MNRTPTRIDLSSVTPPFEDRLCTSCARNWNPQEDGTRAEHVQEFHGIMKGACTLFHDHFVFGLWADASSWSQIIFINYTFKGTLYSTPYHLGPLCPESEVLIAGYKRLRSDGIITTDSQPYTHEIYSNMPYLPSQILEYKQWPDLCFEISTSHPLIPRSKIDALVQGLLKHRRIYATIHSTFHDYPQHGTAVQGACFVEA
jgi:hypothetical protein